MKTGIAVWLLIGAAVVALVTGGWLLPPPINIITAFVFLAEALFLLAVDERLGPPRR